MNEIRFRKQILVHILHVCCIVNTLNLTLTESHMLAEM